MLNKPHNELSFNARHMLATLSILEVVIPLSACVCVCVDGWVHRHIDTQIYDNILN